MKFLLTSAIALTLVLNATAAEGWLTNIDKAKEEAKVSGKALLVKFTGSDWCPPCMMIDKEVFSKKEFTQAVAEKFVLCIIDSPEADKELNKQNKPLLKKYRITGFPTVVLFSNEGTEFTRFNPATFTTVKKMAEQLDLQLRRKEMF